MIELVEACPIEQIYGRPLLQDSEETSALRRAMGEFLLSHNETGSRLSVASGSMKTGCATIQDFIKGERRMSPKRAMDIARVIESYPAGWPKDEGKKRAGRSIADDGSMVPIFITKQEQINAMRDAATRKRAAHIEACRQAELTRYGFTTIGRDVMEMCA